MAGSHDVIVLGSAEEIELRKFIRRSQEQPPGDLSKFEQELHWHVQVFERSLLRTELARYDTDVLAIEVGGRVYRRGRVAAETYTSSAGPIRVLRHLYHAVEDTRQTVVPLELQAGIIAGHWTPLAAEVADTLAALPDAKVVALADGAKENWRILREVAPGATEILDFFHAVEHLQKGFNAFYGEGSYQARLCGKHYRRALRDDEDGAQQVLRALQYRAKTSEGHKAKLIQAEVTFFRNHRQRMRYADYRAQGLPIGSGVVEAACKTLVTQRMKQSGIRACAGACLVVRQS